MSTSVTPAAAPPARDHHFRKLKLGAFVAVLYAYCSSGPFGFEEMVSTSGPGMALLFLLIIPWVFSLPVSLATSEMAARMPVEGGFYRWTRAALGDFCGFACGWWNWIGTLLLSASYAVLLADYCGQLAPLLAHGWLHWMAALGFLIIVAALNIAGVKALGNSSIALLVLVLIPVAALTALGFKHATHNPFLPLLPPGKPWREVYGVGLALGVWLYCGYEQLSTVTEEVVDPARNFFRGLMIVVPLAMVTFFVPTAAAVSATDWQQWTTGYMVTAGQLIGGHTLGVAMFAAAIIAVLLGLESTVFSSTRLPFALAEDGYFDSRWAGLHPRLRTPVFSIAVSTALCAALCMFTVPQLVVVYTLLRAATSILTLLSLPRLRRLAPSPAGTFRVPGGRFGVTVVIALPLLLFAWLIVNADRATLIWGSACLAAGVPAYWLARLKRRNSARG